MPVPGIEGLKDKNISDAPEPQSAAIIPIPPIPSAAEPLITATSSTALFQLPFPPTSHTATNAATAPMRIPTHSNFHNTTIPPGRTRTHPLLQATNSLPLPITPISSQTFQLPIPGSPQTQPLPHQKQNNAQPYLKTRTRSYTAPYSAPSAPSTGTVPSTTYSATQNDGGIQEFGFNVAGPHTERVFKCPVENCDRSFRRYHDYMRHLKSFKH
ncbi:hypothetical protein BCR33DRAFT_787410 [Rhizoclosmatium globosum]|uniref:C2H2-type domain-containing protein n=1 Tax=Rhizoclosmatium globosum TaxID=329046 RepID=A0A1Y2C160_9FUNG|nr:hypothetical protein BCR33DRAFT_787410 [Rhizoclosmatium globosum]|eukprot:ORY40760.1 hypothetical protein BCR33DRAFT_787410 [Rhizoclosmatium globosum]